MSTYIREVIAGISACAPARLAAVVQADAVGELPPQVRAVPKLPSSGARRALQGLATAPPGLLFHGLDVDVPVRRRGLMVSTVHDLAVFDVPSAFSRHRVLGEQLVVGRALRRADAIIAVSGFTAERVKARFKRDAIVVPEAPKRGMAPAGPAAVQEVRERYELPERFALHVGTVEPRKNVGAIAEACRRLSVPLVLAGGAGWQVEPPVGALRLGFVPAADLPALYSAATVAVYASMYEGFGLPPLDALACGCAVVSTPVPSSELVPGGVELARDASPEELGRALGLVVRDEARRSELAAVGRRQATMLTWEAAALATLEVYQDLGLSLPSP